jgi:hypothetical protein
MRSPLRVEFGVRCGVEALKVEAIIGTGPVVTGRWVAKPKILTGDDAAKRLLESFANARTNLFNGKETQFKAQQEINSNTELYIQAVEAANRKDLGGDKFLALKLRQIDGLGDLDRKALAEIANVPKGRTLSNEARAKVVAVIEKMLTKKSVASAEAIEAAPPIQSVVKFTADWGPLTSEFVPGGYFQEGYLQWCMEQMQLRLMWEKFGRTSAPKHWRNQSVRMTADQSGASIGSKTESEIEDPVEDLLTHPANRAIGIPGAGFEREGDENSQYYSSVPLLDSSAKDIYPHAGKTRPAARLEKVNDELELLRKDWAGFFPEDTYTHFAVKSGPFEDFGRTPGAKGTLRVGTHTILWFLTLNLFAIDGRYLRKCWRPDCAQPYFIADDLKVHYCSDECSRWSRSEWKNRWWREHGKEWREAKAKDNTALRKARRRIR